MNTEDQMTSNRSTSPRAQHLVAEAEQRSRMLLLAAAAISFALSVSLWFSGNELQGIFVGLWVLSILSLGAIVLPPGERR
jgi:ABC-type multidrug transport system permease subunit